MPPQTPMPHDIPLPLPAPEPLLIVLLVLAFLAHLLFVNLMLGGSLLTVFYEWRGLRRPAYDHLAHEIAKTVTVNKSLAVVLGVAPLLLINVLYTIYFYTANSLTGLAWILLIPLITLAFVLTYLHKYSWQAMSVHKRLHIGLGLCASGLFLAIPFVFLGNAVLMLFPERWSSIQGFMSVLTVPSVLTRYFHFLFASLGVSGLALVGYFRRRQYDVEAHLPGLSREEVIRQGYTLTLVASCLQFLAGPLVMVSLPSHGFSLAMLGSIGVGVLAALPALWLIWRELQSPRPGQRFVQISGLLSITVLLMVTGRHQYRQTALASHQRQMQAHTAHYQRQVQAAADEAKAATAAEASLPLPALGEKTFQQNCAGCHAAQTKLVGPPMTEMQKIYGTNPAGLKAWVQAPGKKRPDYPQMPGFPQLSPQQLEGLSAYILKTGS